MRRPLSTPHPPVQKRLPENPWLKKVISDNRDALVAWNLIVKLGVDPRALERRLLELRKLEVPAVGLRPLSAKECERAVKRLDHAACDIARLSIEFADVLPGPPPPWDSRLGGLLIRVPPGDQPQRLREWLLHFASAMKRGLKRPGRRKDNKRIRLPDWVHIIGAEIAHLCVVASSFAGLDARGAIRRMLELPGPAVIKIELKKRPGPARYRYEHVANLCNAVLAAQDYERTIDSRSLRRAYDSLHPRVITARESQRQPRKVRLRRERG